jgi:hypothetical protein
MKIERILIITFLLAELALLLALPYGEEALTIGGLILSFGYLILSNWIFERKENSPGDGYRVFAGIVLFWITISIFYRLKVWPDGHLLLMASSFFVVIYLCVCLIAILRRKVELKKLKPIIFRMLIYLSLATLLYFTWGRTILKFQYINNPERGQEIIEILEYRDSINRIEYDSRYKK